MGGIDPGSIPPGPPGSDVGSDQATLTEEIVAAVHTTLNSERARQNLPPLHWSEPLAQVARAHSRRMAEDGFRGHIDKRGQGAAERVTAAGIRYAGIGENVARSTNHDGQVSERVAKGWLDSPDHRANILEPHFTRTGLGVHWDGETYYFTQVFLRP